MSYNKSEFFKLVFWMALVGSYILAIAPMDKVPEITPFSDKGNHFIAFAFLSISLFYAYRIAYMKIALWMLGYGIWIEFTQLFIPNRYGEFMDLVADVIGITIGLIIVFLLQRSISTNHGTT